MLLSIIIGYLIGSLPFSFLIPRLVKGIDIRTIGSGNVGATNVYRACGLMWAFVAFLGDFLKGFVAIIIATSLWGENAGYIAAFATLIGHCYTFILNFDGGKGVSTFSGTLLALNPPIFLIYFVALVILVLLTKIVSLSSMTAIALSAVWISLFTSKTALLLYALTAAIFAIFQHRSNIIRLINGKEKRLSKPKFDPK